ncbi:hypothetical protein B0H63DRAFT_76313 [Podospora didyma]|uniref:Ubiquitin-like domain-containing protein n=1 Tax=Podospora didyma TaxID=330526 RepID=A0AAE0K2I2_9PEZI|nr:hypothetical protein B0H63DRAFT_76313 [Podospora didyma]
MADQPGPSTAEGAGTNDRAEEVQLKVEGKDGDQSTSDPIPRALSASPRQHDASPRQPEPADAAPSRKATDGPGHGSKTTEEPAPIRLKDAVGRSFSFPFNLVKTWAGMEEMIRSAHVHIERIGSLVSDGHYDIIDPNGDIILPWLWERVVQPGWQVSMQLWPSSLPAGYPNRGHQPLNRPGMPARAPPRTMGGARPPPPPGPPPPFTLPQRRRPGRGPPPPPMAGTGWTGLPPPEKAGVLQEASRKDLIVTCTIPTALPGERTEDPDSPELLKLVSARIYLVGPSGTGVSSLELIKQSHSTVPLSDEQKQTQNTRLWNWRHSTTKLMDFGEFEVSDPATGPRGDCFTSQPSATN